MDRHQELRTQQQSRIENLVRRLLDRRRESGADLWEIQLDLVQHLTEVQNGIAEGDRARQEAKAEIAEIAKRRPEGWKRELQRLNQSIKEAEARSSIFKDVRTALKQVGDALAWEMFDSDTRRLTSLMFNAPNPSVPGGLSLLSMLRVAANFWAAGAGFPVLHDVTNCLRVGDITFVHPDDEELLTVEVKSRVVSRDEHGGQLSVVVYAVRGFPKLQSVTDELRRRAAGGGGSDAAGDPPGVSSRQLEKGLVRQLERMSSAITVQVAPHGERVEKFIEGLPPLLLVNLKSCGEEAHWDVVRELAAGARQEGFASRAVDDAFVYAAGYVDDPDSYTNPAEMPFMEKLAADVAGKMPRFADAGRNHILVHTTGRHLTGDAPLHVRPLFAHFLSADVIVDILWRRLTVFVFTNLGKLVEALNAVGVTARLPANDKEFRQFLIPASKRTTCGGRYVDLQFGDIRYFTDKVFYEFQSLSGFASAVAQMAETATGAARKDIWQRLDRQSDDGEGLG